MKSQVGVMLQCCSQWVPERLTWMEDYSFRRVMKLADFLQPILFLVRTLKLNLLTA